MKIKFLVPTLILLSSCLFMTDYQAGPYNSPDSKLELTVSVNRTDKSESDYAYVVLRVVDIEDEYESELNTGIGDAMKWEVGWYDSNVIVAYSADTGNKAWEFNEGKFEELKPTDDMNDFAIGLRVEKYGSE